MKLKSIESLFLTDGQEIISFNCCNCGDQAGMIVSSDTKFIFLNTTKHLCSQCEKQLREEKRK